MQTRFSAQRQHLLATLDSLLYQLHAVSFFWSPSIWMFVFRLLSQFQCVKPKDCDLSRPLRMYFAGLFVLNLPNLWSHIKYGPAEGRAIILDFVGMSYMPSKLQLFTLDITILLLQLILVSISYETALSGHESTHDDTLLPPEPDPDTPLAFSFTSSSPPPSPSMSSSPSTSTPSYFQSTYTRAKPASTFTHPPHVLELRFRPLMTRLRSPAPLTSGDVQRRGAADNLALPFPNTTSFLVPAGVRMMMRSQARRAQAAQTLGQAPGDGLRATPPPLNNNRNRAPSEPPRVPGSMIV